MPRRAATASNSRPALEVSGELSPVAIWCRRTASSVGVGGPHERQVQLPGLVAEGAAQVAQGRPVGPVDGGLAAGQRNVGQVGQAPVAREIAQQELAAPDGAVGAVAGAVPADADDRPIGAVLGQAGGQVGVVVLHGHQRQAGQRAAAGACSRAHAVDR